MHFLLLTYVPRPQLYKENPICKLLAACRTRNYSITSLQDQNMLKCTRKVRQLKLLVQATVTV